MQVGLRAFTGSIHGGGLTNQLDLMTSQTTADRITDRQQLIRHGECMVRMNAAMNGGGGGGQLQLHQ